MGQFLRHHMDGVKHAYLIGESAGAIADIISDVVPTGMYVSLKAAVDAAKEKAVSGDVILLSPACTAFDQFQNFIDRGNAFKAIIELYGKQSQ